MAICLTLRPSQTPGRGPRRKQANQMRELPKILIVDRLCTVAIAGACSASARRRISTCRPAPQGSLEPFDASTFTANQGPPRDYQSSGSIESFDRLTPHSLSCTFHAYSRWLEASDGQTGWPKDARQRPAALGDFGEHGFQGRDALETTACPDCQAGDDTS